jgi:hypothetical protein
MNVAVWAIAVFVFVGPLLAGEVRVWTDKSGRTVEAELVQAGEKSIILKSAKGQFNVPLDRLSDQDREFVRSRAGSAGAPARGANSPVRVQVLGLSVSRPARKPETGGDGAEMSMFGANGMPGTQLTLLLTTKRQIVEVERKTSRVTSFTDDKGTNLAASDRPGAENGFLDRVRPDGHAAILELHSDTLPAAGASKLIAAAEITLRFGEGEKSIEPTEIDLNVGGRFRLGRTEVTVKKDSNAAGGFSLGFPLGPLGPPANEKNGGGNKTAVTLSAKASLSMLKSLTFLALDGTEITSHESGRSRSTFPGNEQHEATYFLDRDVTKVKLKAVQFEKLVSIKVPVAVEAGIGLQNLRE